MIVLALLIFALAGFVGLAIDVIINYNQNVEQDVSAGEVALASLETYMNTSCATGDAPVACFATKLSKAVTRATEVANLARNRAMGDSFVHDLNQSGYLCTESDSSPICQDPDGYIYPGRFHWTAPALGCEAYMAQDGQTDQNCPCAGSGESAQFTEPCFEKINPGNPGTNPSITAFQVIIRTRRDNTIGTQFGSLVGASALGNESISTAAFIPRHAIFLMDLSRSMTRSTHLKTGERLSDLAFKLAGNCPVDNQCNFAGECPMADPFQQPKYNVGTFICDVRAAGTPDSNCSPLVAPWDDEPGDPAIPTIHYKDDYNCYSFSYDVCHGCTTDLKEDCASCDPTATANYIVDEARVPGYDGPQPLTAALGGIHAALDVFKDRNVGGDKVGAYVVDRTTGYFNTDYVDPTDHGFLTRRYPLALIDSDTIDQLYDATDTSNPVPDPLLGLNQTARMLFPLVDQSFSNIPQGLLLAGNLLANDPDAHTADNFVILFSDGVGNCTSDEVCFNDFLHHDLSMAESASLIMSGYQPAKIAFHMFMFGKGSHSLLMKNGSGQCATEGDLREHSSYIPYTDYDWAPLTTDYQAQWSAAFASSPTIPAFYYPAQMYGWVANTNGTWNSVRPCCGSGGNGDCSAAPANIDSLCSGGNLGDLVTNGGAVLGFHDDGFGFDKNLDSEGRLLCDPENRTPNEQIEDYIAAIMAKSPFILVGPD